jgi:hypothetical protein
MSFDTDRNLTSGVWLWLIVGLILWTGCSSPPVGTAPTQAQEQEQEQATALPYFGLDFPTDQVQRFAPAIFKEEMHAPPIFTPDGREVYWSLMDSRGLMFMKIENSVWTDPAPAPFDRGGQGDSPFINSDGTRLLYVSAGLTNEIIKQMERQEDGWGSPEMLPEEVNSHGAHWQASMADNGNLYFGSEGEIFFAEFVNGSYAQALELNSSINTTDAHEGSPFVAPDESYLIFDRAPNSSYADLFITFRNDAGEWDDPVALEALNSGLHELYANVSPDGRFMIFLSNRTGGILLPYWVDAGFIEDYRP